MFALLVIAILIATCNGLPLTPEANVENFNKRILGGNKTTIDKYPYHAILQMPETEAFCGGAIISEFVILTAGHCICYSVESNFLNITIRVGSSYPSKDGTVHEIDKVILHEKYAPDVAPGRVDYDVGIVFVKTPFQFNSRQQPIRLRKSSKEIEDGTMAVISGVGVMDDYGTLADQLYVVSIPYVNKRRCNKQYERTEMEGIGVGQICAGDLGIGGKDSCMGDSGGPMVVNGEVAGIVSYGWDCAHPDYPGVYSDVSYFYDWIVKNAKLTV